MHDGFELLGRGVTAAVICTDAFIPTARAQSEICGDPTFRFAVVPHPLGSLSPAELAGRAAAALPQVIAILTGAPSPPDR